MREYTDTKPQHAKIAPEHISAVMFGANTPQTQVADFHTNAAIAFTNERSR